MKKKYGSGDIIRIRRRTELSLLYATVRIGLFYKPTKYHSNVLNGCGVMLWQPIVDARLTARPPTFIILITRVFRWKTWLIMVYDLLLHVPFNQT